MTTGISAGAKPRYAIWLAKLALILLVAGASAYLIRSWLDGSLDESLFVWEGGVLEVVHSAFAGISTLLFYLSWRDGKGPVKVAGGALAMLAGAAFVREFDIKHVSELTGPQWLYDLADHGLQEVLLIVMTLPIAVYFFRERRYFLDILRMALRWQAWPLYVAGAFIVTGVYLDERVVTSMRMRFWEEFIETYGYGFMMLAAWRHWRLAGDPAWSRGQLT